MGTVFKQKGMGVSDMDNEKRKSEGYRAIPKLTNCECFNISSVFQTHEMIGKGRWKPIIS